MVRPLCLLLVASGCAAGGEVVVIGHRAQGIGASEENRAANVPHLLDAGFGSEIDIRGDGALPFELGHFGPNGDTLEGVLAAIEAAWQPQWQGRWLVLDIANDRGDEVSNNLINYLYERVPSTRLEDIRVVVQSSNEQSLARMQSAHVTRGESLDIRFALTYWISTEYTTASWVDLVAGNVSAFGELNHPKPVILFGVETRASFRRALESRNDVIGVITNHPRRIAELCDCR
jgi:hypothetical protein